jgi:hypothetical protein
LSFIKYEIQHGYKPKKLIKPNPWYKTDPALLAELEAVMLSEPTAQRFKEASTIIARQKPNLAKTTDEFVNAVRRIVRQFDKKHRRT